MLVRSRMQTGSSFVCDEVQQSRANERLARERVRSTSNAGVVMPVPTYLRCDCEEAA
jgi:hypothetical protein